jgi:hypothetical protein
MRPKFRLQSLLSKDSLQRLDSTASINISLDTSFCIPLSVADSKFPQVSQTRTLSSLARRDTSSSLSRSCCQTLPFTAIQPPTSSNSFLQDRRCRIRKPICSYRCLQLVKQLERFTYPPARPPSKHQTDQALH